MTAPLIARLLNVVEHDLVPITREGVRRGNKLFGAAIVRKSDHSLVVAAANAETENPLWHGEIAAIKKFYETPPRERPEPSECLFLSTHEPCAMCLAAITWAGYDNFYYLFGYQDTKNAFRIPHDLDILKEVFDRDDGGYHRVNAYWTAHDIAELVAGLPGPEKGLLEARVEKIARTYQDLSDLYQSTKQDGKIPLP